MVLRNNMSIVIVSDAITYGSFSALVAWVCGMKYSVVAAKAIKIPKIIIECDSMCLINVVKGV